jgi:hypothetical protein
VPDEPGIERGVTNLTRNLARAVTPSLVGYLMQSLALAPPFFLGDGIKITYDLPIDGPFRNLKPEEERTSVTAASEE